MTHILTWLHLSDLHFRESDNYDANIVLKALLRDIGERVRDDELRPDFIAITGDIAFSGKATEYALAARFFDDLIVTTDLAKKRLFIVPGNHDVERSYITAGARAIAKSLADRNSTNMLLKTPSDRQLVFARFTGFAEFVQSYFADYLAFDNERYFYVKKLNVAHRSIAILGLNSAWLAASDADKTEGLLIGELQARTALEATGNVDTRIALMHHPFNWLREFDQNDSSAILIDRCDFILHGHLHRTSMQQLISPDSRAMILAAGACYATRQYPNMYNFVRLDFTNGVGKVFLRRYSDERGGFWATDTLTYRNVPDGEYEFSLRARPESRSIARRVPEHTGVKAKPTKPIVYLQTGAEVLDDLGKPQIDSLPVRTPTRSFFHSKLIVGRPEFSYIVSQLTKGAFFLIVGQPASGKTVLARHIALQMEDRYNVFFLDTRRITPRTFPILLDEINDLPQDSLLVIEDVHLDPRSADSILARSIRLGLRVLMTSRPSFALELSRHETNTVADIPVLYSDRYLEIEAADIADQLITRFEESSGIKFLPQHKREIKASAKNDLWILSYYLSASENGQVDREAVYTEILKDVMDLRKIGRDAPAILLTIARLSEYEIPVDREFLEDELGFDHEEIGGLISMGYVGEHFPEELLYLRHASYAKVLVEAATAQKLYQSKAKKMASHDLEICRLIDRYLIWNINSIFKVIRQLRYELHILQKLMQSEVFREALRDGLNNVDYSTMDASHLLTDITRITDEDLRQDVLGLIDTQSAIERLNEESNLHSIASYLDGFPWVINENAIKLVEESNTRVASIGRDQQKPPGVEERVGFCDWMVRWNRQDAFWDAVKDIYSQYPSGGTIPYHRLDPRRVGFCSKSSEGGKVILCAKTLLVQPAPKSVIIVKQLDIDRLSRTCNTEGDAYTASHILSLIHWIDTSSGRKLLRGLDLSVLLAHSLRAQDNSIFVFFCWTVFLIDRTRFENVIVPNLSDESMSLLALSGWFDPPQSP